MGLSNDGGSKDEGCVVELIKLVWEIKGLESISVWEDCEDPLGSPLARGSNSEVTKCCSLLIGRWRILTRNKMTNNKATIFLQMIDDVLVVNGHIPENKASVRYQQAYLGWQPKPCAEDGWEHLMGGRCVLFMPSATTFEKAQENSTDSCLLSVPLWECVMLFCWTQWKLLCWTQWRAAKRGHYCKLFFRIVSCLSKGPERTFKVSSDGCGSCVDRNSVRTEVHTWCPFTIIQRPMRCLSSSSDQLLEKRSSGLECVWLV